MAIMTLQALISAQEEKVAVLKKRLAGIDLIIAQSTQERNALGYDVVKEIGFLEGLNAARALEVPRAPEKGKDDLPE